MTEAGMDSSAADAINFLDMMIGSQDEGGQQGRRGSMSTADVVPSNSHSEQCVFAKYEYHYTNNKGEVVQMFEGQRFFLLDKTNRDWWHVRRVSTTMEMFVPASYMQIVEAEPASPLDHSSINNSNPISPTVHSDYDPNSSCESAKINASGILSPERDYLHNETPPADYGSSFEEPPKPNHVSVVNVGNISHVGPRTQVDNNIVPTKKQNPASLPPETLPGNHEPVVYTNLQELKMIRQSSQAAKQNEQEYANLSEIQALISKPPPKKPEASDFVKNLDDKWDMYTESLTGRNYYNNLQTGETTWKPPRLAEKILDPVETNSVTVAEKKSPSSPVKEGWSHEHDDNGDTVFVHQSSNEKWLSSVDDNGRRYYYREGTNESRWDLPEVSPKIKTSSLSDALPDLPPLPAKERHDRWNKARSMIIDSGLRFDIPPVMKSSTMPSILSTNEPLSPIGMPLTRIFLQGPKDGMLNKAKLMEGGRKVKKTWSQSYVVLTGSNLVFYKDQKAAQVKPGSPHGKPEFILSLHGAKVKFDPKEVTSKKNVILVITNSDAQFLLQSDDFYRVHNWHEALTKTIQMLNQGMDIPTTIPEDAANIESTSQLDISTSSASVPAKMSSKAAQKHVYLRSTSLEDNTPIQEERKKSIRNILYHFITRRPSAELLRAKGIIKENVFGCALKQTCDKDHSNVPNFVKQCIAAIESKGLDQDGLYRISGHISQIQKLRMLVDQEQSYCMDDEQWEIHVLTSTLKLFFRELKEPLFPFDFYDKFVSAIQLHMYQARLTAIRDLIAILPKCHLETVKVLFYHLKNNDGIEVTKSRSLTSDAD